MVLKKNKTSLYFRFLGFLNKNGKYISASKILKDSLEVVSLYTKYTVEKIFIIIFSKLNTFVETKKITSRKRVHFVPFPITYVRRSYLVMHWLFDVIKQDIRKIPTSEKLASEFLKILNSSTSKTERLKKKNLISSFKNRSNIHYRW